MFEDLFRFTKETEKFIFDYSTSHRNLTLLRDHKVIRIKFIVSKMF